MDPLPSLSITIPPSLSHLPPLSAHEVSAILSSYQQLPPPLPIPISGEYQDTTSNDLINPSLLDPLSHQQSHDASQGAHAPHGLTAQTATNPTSAHLLAFAQRLLSTSAAYGSPVPLLPSRRSKWAIQELERLARAVGMEVFSESELPTSPMWEGTGAGGAGGGAGDGSPFPTTPSTPFPTGASGAGRGEAPGQAHMHNILLGAGEFLIDITVSFSSASPCPRLVALVTSNPANPALDRLLARHLSAFFAMLTPQRNNTAEDTTRGEEEEEEDPRDVDTIRIAEHLHVFQRWLEHLRTVQGLVKADEDAGKSSEESKRWWTVLSEVATEWEGRMARVWGLQGEGDASDMEKEDMDDDRPGEGESIPVDLIPPLTPLPLPYLHSPSLTFLLSLSPRAYLSILRRSTTTPSTSPKPTSSANTSKAAGALRTHPPLDDLRDFLLSPPSSLPSETYQQATLSLLSSPNPQSSFPHPGSTSPLEGKFPTSEGSHWSLQLDPPVWVRTSAAAGLPGLGGMQVQGGLQDGVVGQTGEWVGAVLGPRLTASPTYTWRTHLPNKRSKSYNVTFAPSPGSSLDGGIQLARIPVRSAAEIRTVLEVVRGECWLAQLLRGLQGGAEAWDASQAAETGEEEVTIEQLLAGELPGRPNVPITLVLAPYSPPLPLSNTGGTGTSTPSPPAPAIRLTILPHLTLSIAPPSSTGNSAQRGLPKIERLSLLPPPNSGPESARDWEARAAQVLRRGGIPFLLEWAYEGEHELVKEYPGKQLVPDVHHEDQQQQGPEIRVTDAHSGLGELDLQGMHGLGMGIDQHLANAAELDAALAAAGQSLGVSGAAGAGGDDGSTAFDDLFGGSTGDVGDLGDLGSGFGDHSVAGGGMGDLDMDLDLGDGMTDLSHMGGMGGMGGMGEMHDLPDMGDMGMDMNMDDLGLGATSGPTGQAQGQAPLGSMEGIGDMNLDDLGLGGEAGEQSGRDGA